MNKKIILNMCLLAALFASSTAAAYMITGHAYALIRTAIGSSEGQQMNFGTIDANATGGKVTLAPAGTVTATGGLILSATASQGQISVTANPNTTLTVSIADGSLTGPGTAMTVNNYLTSPVGPSLSTGATGTVTLNIGADLSVGANQAQGAYSGTYNITINY